MIDSIALTPITPGNPFGNINTKLNAHFYLVSLEKVVACIGIGIA